MIIEVISLQLRASPDHTRFPYAWGKTSRFKGYVKNGNINGGSQWEENMPAIHTSTENTFASVNGQWFIIIASQLLCVSGKKNFCIYYNFFF